MIGVSLGTLDRIVLGTDEGIIITSNDGELLVIHLKLQMVSHLDSMKELRWVLQMAPLMVLMNELCCVFLTVL